MKNTVKITNIVTSDIPWEELKNLFDAIRTQDAYSFPNIIEDAYENLEETDWFKRNFITKRK